MLTAKELVNVLAPNHDEDRYGHCTDDNLVNGFNKTDEGTNIYCCTRCMLLQIVEKGVTVIPSGMDLSRIMES